MQPNVLAATASHRARFAWLAVAFAATIGAFLATRPAAPRERAYDPGMESISGCKRRVLRVDHAAHREGYHHVRHDAVIGRGHR